MKLQPWPIARLQTQDRPRPSNTRKCFQSLIMSVKGLSELETDKETHITYPKVTKIKRDVDQ